MPYAASATTYYVNSDSNNAHSTPTRAFNNASYTPNDSYSTLDAAIAVAVNGDTIEFSGGASGKSYSGSANSIQKAITIQGSRITGFNGPVTISYVPAKTYALGLNADGITLDNLIISGANLGKALSIYKNNELVKNTIIQDPYPGATTSLQNNFALWVNSTGTNNIFQNVVIKGNVNSQTTSTGGRGIYIATAVSNVTTFNNCVVENTGDMMLYSNPNTTVNFNNCSLASNGKIVTNPIFDFATGGGTPPIVNTSNTVVQGMVTNPHVMTLGTGTWNSSSTDLNDAFPYFKNTKSNNLGFIALSTDDIANVDYFTTNANYAMNTYGIPLTLFVNNTNNLTSAEKTKLQTLYKAGHEIGVHTRDHNDMSLTTALKITYSGAAVNEAFVVSSNGTSLSITGSADTHGPFDLTNASYDTLAELCNTIQGFTNFACQIASSTSAILSSSTLSYTLKDTSTSLTRNTFISIPFDDQTTAANRYYTEEITNSISDLSSALHEDPACAAYVPKTLALPYHGATQALLDWVRTYTSLTGMRANDSVGNNLEKGWLGNINVYNAYIRPFVTNLEGSGYSALSALQKQDRIQKGARVMASFASDGYFSGLLSHNGDSDLTNQEWQWLLDELVKYRSYVRIDTFANLFNEIENSGNWTNAGSGVYTRTFSGTEDLRLTPSSTLINAGTTIAGRTSDFIGNALVGTTDIGVYEYQLPNDPTGLAQYQADGVTVLPSGDAPANSTVVFNVAMSSSNASDSLTPQIEIEPSGTSFAGVATQTGIPAAFTGNTIAQSITVSSLSPGSYHWRAGVTNAVGSSNWVSMGAATDFVIADQSARASSNHQVGAGNVITPNPIILAGDKNVVSTVPTTTAVTPVTSTLPLTNPETNKTNSSSQISSTSSVSSILTLTLPGTSKYIFTKSAPVYTYTYSIKNPNEVSPNNQKNFYRFTRQLVDKKNSVIQSGSAKIDLVLQEIYTNTINFILPKKAGEYTVVFKLTSPSGKVLDLEKQKIVIEKR